MKIIFEDDIKEVMAEFKKADNYLDCENIILNNLKKHNTNKISAINIEAHLKKLLEYLEDKSVINKGNKDCINYTYASGFLRNILCTPYWYSRVK